MKILVLLFSVAGLVCRIDAGGIRKGGGIEQNEMVNEAAQALQGMNAGGWESGKLGAAEHKVEVMVSGVNNALKAYERGSKRAPAGDGALEAIEEAAEGVLQKAAQGKGKASKIQKALGALVLDDIVQEQKGIAATGMDGKGPAALEKAEDAAAKALEGDSEYLEFRRALYDFDTKLYKIVAKYNKDHFAVSLTTVWMTLAAMAEGCNGPARMELFKELNLPEDPMERQRYYDYVTKLETPGDDVYLDRKRFLVLDSNLRVNESWANDVASLGLLRVDFAPIKTNPAAVASQVQQNFLLNRQPEMNFEGNSILFDVLDFHGLWTVAFPDAYIEKAPFFNDFGKQIGTVEMMKMNKQVKLAHLPALNAKVLELPVGVNGRYTMFFVINVDKTPIRKTVETYMNTIIFEILENLRESLIPLEIAIPKFSINTEFDVRPYLEEMGIRSLWRDPSATAHMSEPSALPSSLIQRVALKMDKHGVEPATEHQNDKLSKLVDIATGLEAAVGRDFIGNRPFMYGLFDIKTRSCLFAGVFSAPDSA